MSSAAPALGFAVCLDGEVVIRTVSPTLTGAQVNGLVCIFGVVCSAGDSDAEVERRWQEIEARQVVRGLAIRRVEVRPI